MESFLTIKENASYTAIIKKSEFICHIARTENETEALAFIEKINTEHRKATHNCYAYTLGMHDEIQRASDNGEPSGTAGVPILEVLKNNELHNVTAIVTRYFGGIKLGAGGLIRAYSGTTADAIKEIGIVKKTVQTAITLKTPYPLQGKMQNYLEEHDINLLQTDYGVEVDFIVGIDSPQVENFCAQIIDIFNAKVNYEIGDENYVEVPVN
ncbi:YigZ family protein [Ligilactobacillus equi]|uniref:YigZ family protein n=1 Tax=Ligilactobacillus equi DPC 6820 TaxID=1392007 RepID=V7HZK7_9LACO|nr:YigZ family protein [Ligilactobacillus equi]ETA74725.1 hypothetical protein LEQ_0739c [Ligilactobacillus equi DPC 6820]